ncbi:Uncharacterised protein [Mycobacterium tuberculosis]|uniref:Uncharacterized protein n=1 Tax=Mycobacterium tuberculosis TaxID=1773 RepID=A0A0U0S397_MYCTX|nr:Uncharacterised protein [Mycobacterium tuberculosis]COW72211.1 Uncharacterised protein [Mycobacterium tuberculosis]COY25192.1 Uncharacterised protein [Mycobacterium tuberculosis]
MRLIRLEVGNPGKVDGVGAQRFKVGVTQIGFAIRPGQNVGTEVGVLAQGIDDIAPGVQQYRVVVIEPGDDFPEIAVELRVGGRPCTAVAGIVQPHRILVRREWCSVVRLKIPLGRRSRQQRGDVEFIAGRAFDGCDEFVVVVVDDRLLLGGADRGVSQLVKAGREPHDGIDNRESTFVNDQRIRQVRK